MQVKRSLKIQEKLKKEYISNNKKFVYDEMEDATGMNNIEECEGMSSLGTSPTPNLGKATINNNPVPSKSVKKNKGLKELTNEVNGLLKNFEI